MTNHSEKDFEGTDYNEDPKPVAKPVHPLLQFFKWEHLPEHLQSPSKWFSALAHQVNDLPDNREKDTALRKLLEAKDCAVRALLYKSPLDNPDMGIR